MKWPYRHLYNTEKSEKVSIRYFAAGQFRSRGWTIYYVQTLLDDTKPLLLIPREEVLDLFEEIYVNLKIPANFPDVTRHPGFDIGFEEEGSPRPRYLGRLTDETSLLELEEMIPEPGTEPGGPQVLEDRTFPAFRRKMEAAILAGKNRQKNAKSKKKQDRVVQKRGWCAQLKRAQCYLGIRPRGTARKEDFHNDPNHTYEESQAAQAAYEKAAGLKLPTLIPTLPAPYPFENNVVFVCVDVESYEKDHQKVTEIGISTLDTLDLVNNSPKEGGLDWMKKIRARHFRIAEYAHLNNTEFVTGCADKFEERFGKSEWISINEAPQVIASCFRHPFSAPGQYLSYPADARVVGRYGSGSQYLPPVNDNAAKRNIILVGHDISADIHYLRSIGYDVSNLSNLLEAIDTVDLFRAMKHGQNPSSLGSVLLDLGLIGWNLHNAGNDAGYTVEALIGICFKALTYEHPENPDPERLSTAAAEAQARVIEETEEWEIADEEGGDGGSAVKLLPAAEMAQARAFQKGLNRAVKAEDRSNRSYARNDARNRQRGDPCGGKGMNVNDENFPALKPSIERKGEIKYHSANEKKMREKAAQDLEEDGWGWIGEDDGKAVRQKDGADEQNGNTTPQNSQPERDPNYVPPHKRAVQKRTLKEPKENVENCTEANSTVLDDKPKEIPLPPQRLMARMKLLDAYEDDADGGIPLI
ncbi:MAG: hypothetical protein Q9161_001735 [Pseudevernia consocians]